MKQQRYIIIFLITFFIASSAWLFSVSNNVLEKNENKNWWAVYFINPESKDLSFSIENHSDSENFHWEVFADKNKIKEEDVIIKKGSSLNFNPEINLDANIKKVTILVSSQEEKREIYKNFNFHE